MTIPPRDDFSVVRQFLVDYYRSEPNNDRAATAAVTAITGAFAKQWKLATSLRAVIDGKWPNGALMGLVEDASGRLVEDDEEARRFLEMVFDDNALEIAFDPDDL